jgi:O-methyltransferase
MSNIFFRSIRFPFRLFGYDVIKKQSYDPVIDEDLLFINLYKQCKPYTMTSKERMYALYKSVEFIINKDIKGDFVECGVWKGGSSMMIALTLLANKTLDRKIYLYDTFEGMSEPTEDDISLKEKKGAKSFWKKKKKGDINLWCYGGIDEVKANMTKTNYSIENIIFVKGMVEKTIPNVIPSKISLLRLDTDWYESTKHELIHLFPVLQQNGVLIIDDYGHWAGAKKACDEYFVDKPILLNRVDYTGRVGVKP